MINIKNFTIFKCDINESFHWSKLPKLKQLMSKNIFNLSSADLRYANLRYADLRSADLCYANLRYADLRSADLRSADLCSADLSYADLSYAKLKPIKDKEVIIEDFMSVFGLGSQNRQTLIFKTNIGIVIQCGCFYGTEKEFKKKVKETHKDNNYAKEYLEMLKLVKIRFNRGKDE